MQCWVGRGLRRNVEYHYFSTTTTTTTTTTDHVTKSIQRTAAMARRNVASRRNSASSTTSFGSRTARSVRTTTSAADEAMAATAGSDTWKTWAGRSHGTEEFELMDIYRGFTRSVNKRFFLSAPPLGTTCPVCFCEPDEWHITSSCSHAVCLDCLQAYAQNQIRDREQTGPLRCPVCPQPLRRSDAIKALGHNKELVRLWDLKMRNQLLRALPAFRSCPKCNPESVSDDDNQIRNADNDDENNRSNDRKNGNKSGGGVGGGGFVTPECLSPHYKERRESATNILRRMEVSKYGIFAAYFLLVYIVSTTPSGSPLADLAFMLLSLGTTLRAVYAFRRRTARSAREAFFKPITVGCPCCGESFILPTESKHVQDEETSKWMNANTRPCPSCSVPIHKIGGCNHMKCGHCQANFCWACMRAGTTCGAWQCKNGAPYRNAVPGNGPINDLHNGNAGNNSYNQQAGNTPILSSIDTILEGKDHNLNHVDSCILLISLFGRKLFFVRTIAESAMYLLTGIFTVGFFFTFVLGYVIIEMINAYRRQRNNGGGNNNNHHRHPQHRARQEQQRQRRRPTNVTVAEMLLGVEQRNEADRQRNANLMTEQQMIAEAVRRSRIEM